MHVQAKSAAGAVPVVLMLVGCTSSTELGMTKDEARAAGGKSDHIDLCDALHWYGDGICDDFCPSWDEDCGPEPGGCGGIFGLTCGEGQYCHYEEGDRCGAADQLGTCQARPDSCREIYGPVCGCDGETYGNACEANTAGTSVASTGPCEPTCATVLDCEQPHCLRGGPCPWFECVDGQCVAQEEPECRTDEDCEQPVCFPGGPCPRSVCEAGECANVARYCGGIAGVTCPEEQFCYYEREDICGGADALGVCQLRPDLCSAVYNPVCGCDGETYSSACDANTAGTSVAADGPC